MPNPRGQLVPLNAPKGQLEVGYGSTNKKVQTIHTLRSGKRVDNQVQVSFDNYLNSENLNKEKKKETPEESIKKDDKAVIDTKEKLFVPKALFPQHLQANRKKNHCEENLDVSKNVQINISFLDAINQIRSYAKFLKDLTTVKRKTSIPIETIFAAKPSCLIQ